MPTLTAKDYEAVLDCIGFANDLDGPDPFPEPVLERLRRLIGCDAVSYGDFARWRRRNLRAAPRGVLNVPKDVVDAADTLLPRYPVLLGMAPPGRPLLLSDVMTPREFLSSPLYADVGRPLGIKDAMNLTLVDRGRAIGGFGFDASSRAFGERDRRVLDVLTPHLVRLHRAARVRATIGNEVLTRREREVLELVAEGCTNRQVAAALRIAVGTVDKHLDNVYAKLGVGSRAAAVATLLRS